MDQFTERRRHSAAHILAMAALRLFPNVKLGIGPVTNQGFYHDFEFPRRLDWEDVKNLEAEMHLIIQENQAFTRLMVPRDQAFSILMTRGQVYKSELLQDIPDEEISFYQTGEEFIDLCRGPHMDSTGKVGVVKLLEITDVHWRNNPDRPALQRIHGAVFATPAELTQYLERLDAIKQRDLRKFAYELELITGEAENQIYTDKGALTISVLRNTVTEPLLRNGFNTILPGSSSQLNGLQHYLDDFFNYKNRSYRTLPLKVFAENRILLDTPHRISGKALPYVYAITAKEYTTNGAVFVETKNVLELCLEIVNNLGIKPEAQLAAADQELPAFKQLADMLAQRGVGQTQMINAQLPPQTVVLNLIAVDSLKREWSILKLTYTVGPTEYVNNANDFDLTHNYTIDVILENTLGYYLEELEGGLPFWLAPVQAIIIPISENQTGYAEHIASLLNQAQIRADVDNRAETMQARIREAELTRIPIILIIGDKEQNVQAVSVRLRNRQELGLIGEDILIDTLQDFIESTKQ
jgi:threonyl-tRNA synthetase